MDDVESGAATATGKGFEHREHPGDGPSGQDSDHPANGAKQVGDGSGLGMHAAQAESAPREEAMADGIASMVSIATSPGNGR